MLDRLLGNDQLKSTLRTALGTGRLGHSVLLCGEEGSGAGFAARCLAADYLYPQGGPGAEQVMAGTSPECISVRGEGASGEIRIDRIRQVRRQVYDTALSARGRVVILYHAQMLNAASANALLKVLEEPPQGVLFLLTANSQGAVLGTIRSRCGIYTVAPALPDDCARWLQQNCAGCSPDPGFLARLYDGHIGLCRAVATDPVRRQQLQTAREVADLAAQHKEYELLRLLSGYEKDKAGALVVLRDLACLASATLKNPGFCPLSARQAGRAILRADEAAAALAANASAKLVLTNLAVCLARI